jgi:hypothetical protein
MFSNEEIKRNINNVERQILFNIQNLLVEQNDLLKQLITEKSSNADDIQLKRPDLMKAVSKLKEKPKGWHTMSNDKLIEILEGSA